MKLRISLVVFFTFCLSAAAFGQQAKLEGRVLDDKDGPVSGVRIVVAGGQAAMTDEKGHFLIGFPASIQPGQATSVKVVKPNWVVYEPMFGNCVTQSVERNYEPLRVVIVPRGSPLALSPSRLSRVIAQGATERIRLRSEVETLRSERDDYAFLDRYAKEYGFTSEQVLNAVDQWAQIKDSDDKEDRALKAYSQKNYGSAAQQAEESARAADEELRTANKKTNEASLKLIRRYQLAGNAYSEQYKFRQALAAYNEIETRFDTRQLSKETFIAEWAGTKYLIGDAKAALGVRVEGEDSTRLLKEALTEYQQSASFYTREQSPQDWAETQSNLGNALQSIGVRVGGPESIRYLNEAIVAYRSALEVLTPDRSPKDWAETQINLGTAIWSLGERVQSPESIKYLEAALKTVRSAFKVVTREHLARQWAAAQTNLGNVLLSLGQRVGPPESVEYLNEADLAYRAALEIFTREHLSQQWASTQNDLGNVLLRLGERASGADSLKYLNDAVTAYRATFGAITRSENPQQWATTQNNLANVFQRLAERESGVESIDHLKEALAACRAALEVFTKDHLTPQWAITQNSLGNVLQSMGVRVTGSQRSDYLNGAVAAYRAALEVRTSKAFPQDWEVTQNNLAKAYLLLQDWSNAANLYTNLLTFDPDNRDAYAAATSLYHDILFRFEESFVLNQQWLARHPEDVSAQADVAEALFTVGRFAECGQRVDVLLATPIVPSSVKVPLRAVEIASLLAEGKAGQTTVKIDLMIADVTHQPPDFKLAWSFNGTKHFVDQSEKLSRYRGWLGQLFDALGSKDRDTMLKALQQVRSTFKEQN